MEELAANGVCWSHTHAGGQSQGCITGQAEERRASPGGCHLRMATAASRRAKPQQHLAMQASAKTTKPGEERLQY